MLDLTRDAATPHETVDVPALVKVFCAYAVVVSIGMVADFVRIPLGFGDVLLLLKPLAFVLAGLGVYGALRLWALERSGPSLARAYLIGRTLYVLLWLATPWMVKPMQFGSDYVRRLEFGPDFYIGLAAGRRSSFAA